MTEMKERAIDIILRFPDENMLYVMGVLQNLEAMMAVPQQRPHKMDAFLSAAGKIQIDSDAVAHLREESMI